MNGRVVLKVSVDLCALYDVGKVCNVSNVVHQSPQIEPPMEQWLSTIVVTAIAIAVAIVVHDQVGQQKAPYARIRNLPMILEHVIGLVP